MLTYKNIDERGDVSKCGFFQNKFKKYNFHSFQDKWLGLVKSLSYDNEVVHFTEYGVNKGLLSLDKFISNLSYLGIHLSEQDLFKLFQSFYENGSYYGPNSVHYLEKFDFTKIDFELFQNYLNSVFSESIHLEPEITLKILKALNQYELTGDQVIESLSFLKESSYFKYPEGYSGDNIIEISELLANLLKGISYSSDSESFYEYIFKHASAKVIENLFSSGSLTFSDVMQIDERGRYANEEFGELLIRVPSLIEMLKESGVNLNLENSAGFSILTEMISFVGDESEAERSTFAIKKMISLGSNPTNLGGNLFIKDVNLLHVLVFDDDTKIGNYQDLVEFLVLNGCKNTPILNKRFKPSDRLIENGEFELAKILLGLSDISDSNQGYPGKQISEIESVLRGLNNDKAEIQNLISDIENLQEKEYAQLEKVFLYSIAIKKANLFEKILSFGFEYQGELDINMFILTSGNVEMIEAYSKKEADIMHAKNVKGLTFMHMVAKDGDDKKFLEYAQKGYDVDALSSEFQTPIDVLINKIRGQDDFDQILDKVLKYSKDPFYIDKEIDFDSSKIFLGIPTYGNVWDTEHIKAVRVMMEENPNIRGRCVTSEDVEQGLLPSFNGFVVPGGGDSYPEDKPEGFSLSDFSIHGGMEQAYIDIFKQADEYQVPIVGMCLGNQYHGLINNEALYKTESYNGGEHLGGVQKGSMAQFLMLSPDQQSRFIADPNYNPDLLIKIDTAHNYAIKSSGDNPERIGIYSEEGVVQSYSILNHHTFQFHPEHYADDNKFDGANTFNTWVSQYNVFVSLASMAQHHRQAQLTAAYKHYFYRYDGFDPADSDIYKRELVELRKYYEDLEAKIASKSTKQCANVESYQDYHFGFIIESEQKAGDVCPVGAEQFQFGDEIAV